MFIFKEPFVFFDNISADDFLLKCLEIGKPSETTLIGVFDNSGRGSRREIELPLHQDGDYSAKKAREAGLTFDKKVDYVALYCVKGNEDAVTVVKHDDEVLEFVLKPNQALIFNNKKCYHGRRGTIGDRLLLRVWIETIDGVEDE